MTIHIVQVSVIPPYSLEILFDNGVHKRVNLRRELYGPIFELLRDTAFFALAFVDENSHTVTWPNGADFAPDYLYQFEPAELGAEIGV
jgi:hypothetical protein